MTTITPRIFATRRIVHTRTEYEKISNLIAKYGCPVSKVSDFLTTGFDKPDITTVLYFGIPTDSKESFLKEEQQ